MLKLKYDIDDNKVSYTLATSTQTEAETTKMLCHNIRVENPMLTYDKKALFAIKDLYDRKLVSATLSDLFERFFVDDDEKSISNMGAIELLEKVINAYLDVSMEISRIESDVLPTVVKLEPYIRVSDDSSLNFSTKANDKAGQKVSLRTIYDFTEIMDNKDTPDTMKNFITFVTNGNSQIRLCEFVMILMQIAWETFKKIDA